MKPLPPAKLFFWYYFVAIVLVLVVGTISSVFTFKKVSDVAQETLLESANMMANLIQTSNFTLFSGNESDLANPAYISLKDRLKKIPETNKDIRFIYLWGHREGYPYFIIDSEPENSPDYSPPGQIYEEATQLDHDMFLKELPPSVEISTDRWGTWLTALVPIRDSQTDRLVAVMGVDMSAHKYLEVVYIYTAIPILVTIFVLALIVVGFILTKREQKFLKFKSELVSIASHEIRAPLTGVSWLANGILRDTDNLLQRQKEDISIIKNKIDGLIATINDLLEGAATEKINKKSLVKSRINAQKLFEEITKDLSLIFEERKIKSIIDASITPEISILGDYDRVKKMFVNLISNAIKYSKTGKTITIGLSLEKEDYVFWVKDEGIGIPLKDQRKIFEGFFRTEDAKKITDSGTGMGLHYVKQIAELHDGEVWCESELGKGSIFYVRLPQI